MLKFLSRACWAVAVVFMAQTALAADAAAGAYSWSGFYIGATAGGVMGETRVTDTSPPPGYNNFVGDTWSFKKNGFTGAAQAGYNLQKSFLFLGGELDLGYLGISQDELSPQSVIQFGGDTRAKIKTDFYTAARLRLGVALDRLLVFMTAGWIGARSEISVVDRCTTPPCGPLSINAKSDDFQSGSTAGGGLEFGFSDRTSLKLEYMFIDFGKEKVKDLGVAAGFTFPGSWKFDTEAHVVRVGLNYRF
jgi:outer membrane immunogenic protein